MGRELGLGKVSLKAGEGLLLGKVTLVGCKGPQDGLQLLANVSCTHTTVATHVLVSLGVCSLGDILGQALSIGGSTS